MCNRHINSIFVQPKRSKHCLNYTVSWQIKWSAETEKTKGQLNFLTVDHFFFNFLRSVIFNFKEGCFVSCQWKEPRSNSVHTTTKWFFSGMPLIRWKSRSDEGPMLEMPAFKSLYAGQFTSSTQLLKPNYIVILAPMQHHSFFRDLSPLYACYHVQRFDIYKGGA